jgi:DNA-binding NarL/FixJ family response regulator
MFDLWIMAPSAARREWLVRCFSESTIRVAGMAPTFPFLRSLMAETSADVAIIDVQSERESAIARDWLPELPGSLGIVILASEHDPALFNHILHARTGAMLRADASAEQIVQATKSVVAGLIVLDSAVAMQRRDEDRLIEPLTPRESEVLQLLADGLGNKEIASRLSISEHTIKFHIRSILGKLGASSRTEAVSRGLRSGLIEL